MQANEGWIKLYRKFTDWEWYQDIPTKCLFLHLLLSANHADKKWRGNTIRKGELVTSVASLSLESGLSERQVRTALSKLELTGEIVRQATNKYTHITVVNYSVYQVVDIVERQTIDTQNDKQATNKRQTNDKQATTNKNEKNEKNIKKYIYGSFNNVRLSQDEYDKLHADGLLGYIEILSEGKERKGYTYKSDYLAIRKWAANDKKKTGKLQSKPSFDIDEIAKRAEMNEDFDV